MPYSVQYFQILPVTYMNYFYIMAISGNTGGTILTNETKLLLDIIRTWYPKASDKAVAERLLASYVEAISSLEYCFNFRESDKVDTSIGENNA